MKKNVLIIICALTGIALMFVTLLISNSPLKRIRSSIEKAYTCIMKADELQSLDQRPVDKALVESVLQQIKKIESDIPNISDTIRCLEYSNTKLKDVVQSFTARYGTSADVRRLLNLRYKNSYPRDDMTDELLAIKFELDAVLGSASSISLTEKMVSIIAIILVASVPFALIVLGIARKGIWYIVAAIVYSLVLITILKILVVAGRGPWGGYKL